MCVPPATLMPHVMRNLMALAKFVTASMALLEMEETSVKVRKTQVRSLGQLQLWKSSHSLKLL